MSRSLIAVTVLLAMAALALSAGCPPRRVAGPPPGPIGTPPTPSGTPPTPAGTPPAPTPAKAYTYVCPTHPDQKSDKPGKCPTCGAYMKADTTEPVEYFCPKDTGVVKSEPGACETCGEPLQARPAAGAPPVAPTGEPKALEGTKAAPAGPAGERTTSG
jgi:Heavy metal binding domain